MQLFDTATQLCKPLDIPADTNVVSMYVCGITPYDAAHLGHIFTFLTYDLIVRRLEDQGLTVRQVRNITDVDEPIFVKAAQLGIPYQQLAKQETDRLHQVVEQLNFRPLHAEPKASEYIDGMAAAVKKLLDSGIAYQLDNDIYFDISRYAKFGDFSKFSPRLQLAFMKDRGGDPERPGKRQPLDFLLWRGISDPTDPAAWDSPVGRGRPGWHIECSIMSAETLGTPLTLHGGGMDLIFPHHECEIAQSSSLAATNQDVTEPNTQPFARHWVHTAPLLYQGEKMSKSLGNLVFAHDLLKEYPPSVIRLALMQMHYRTGGEWRHDSLHEATELAALLSHALDHPAQLPGDKYLSRIRSALDTDLDTHCILHSLRYLAQETLESASQSSRAQSAKSVVPLQSSSGQLAQALALLGLINDQGELI